MRVERIQGALEDVHYPEGDGRPVAETEIHRDNLFNLLFALRHFFEHRPDVVVSGNLLIYYVEGNPRAVVVPDLFVVFGIPRRPRRIYKVWEEGKGPDVVIELTSASTRWEDLGSKKGLYEALGVASSCRFYYHRFRP
ncbi:Uma2 family endonuclease [Thermoflexus hugenholtzii]|uniref:Putative restriction endonuclease n=1 Tax=Thermoflexus hugenholtzii JAD2 TaxID=877466 RepID=A0A212R4S5_9CHLR|nr:Uma2 family endonuclease [Thermoflexus hugenholtzii]SNB67053.1 Putative restriction endonuclease [Thermoflexus hugenholtzii JAD2]